MRQASYLIVLGLVLSTFHQVALGQTLVEQFDARFAKEIASPAEYSRKVATECTAFPEGQLFPYTFVALGWCHQIYGSPQTAKAKLPQVEAMLRLAYQSASKKLGVGDLSQLTGVNSQGAYVSNLAMASAAYRLAGGTQSTITNTEKHLVSLLAAELVNRSGQPINSYPDMIWPMETSIALMALELHDRVEGTKVAGPLFEQHLQWLTSKGLDPGTGLPASQILSNGKLVTARGCDLSWRLALWSELNSSLGKQWYQKYHSVFWRKSKLFQGFREWGDSRYKTIDIDSGPIVDQIGGTATVLGVSSTRAYQDQSSTDIVMKQAVKLAKARRSKDLVSIVLKQTLDGALKQSGIRPSDNYVTGFLFGDCTAFYSMSWNAYPARTIAIQ